MAFKVEQIEGENTPADHRAHNVLTTAIARYRNFAAQDLLTVARATRCRNEDRSIAFRLSGLTAGADPTAPANAISIGTPIRFPRGTHRGYLTVPPFAQKPQPGPSQSRPLG